jgi:hypothetical protein
LLRFPSYRYGMITGLIVNLGEIGVLFAASLYLQGTKGLSAFETGLALLPWRCWRSSARPPPEHFCRLGPVDPAAGMIVSDRYADSGPVLDTETDCHHRAAAGVYGLGLGLASRS